MKKQNELLINEAKSNNLSVKRNKQIEEMAKMLCYNCARDVTPCSITRTGIMCDAVMEQSEVLYNADYRKASDVAREIFEEIEEGVKAAFSALQFENNHIHKNVKHETLSSLMRFIKTVEKKFIGEDINAPTNTEGGE